jgi:hypothetical protein
MTVFGHNTREKKKLWTIIRKKKPRKQKRELIN